MSNHTRIPPADETERPASDPDDGSTWSTIDGTAEIEDVMNEEDLDDFLVEPIPDPLADPLDMSTS